jgi:hypothetical protein
MRNRSLYGRLICDRGAIDACFSSGVHGAMLPAYVFGMLAITWLPLPSLSHCHRSIGVVGAVLSGARRVAVGLRGRCSA